MTSTVTIYDYIVFQNKKKEEKEKKTKYIEKIRKQKIIKEKSIILENDLLSKINELYFKYVMLQLLNWEILNRNNLIFLEENYFEDIDKKCYLEKEIIIKNEYKNPCKIIEKNIDRKFVEIEDSDSDDDDDDSDSFIREKIVYEKKDKMSKDNSSSDDFEDINNFTEKIELTENGVNINKINEIVIEYDYVKNDKFLNKLYDYQKKHFVLLEKSLLDNKIIIDASDTGTGKTYVNLSLAKKHNLKVLVVCPKSMISTWFSVANYIGIKLYGVSNYECITRGKYYTETMKKTKCKFIKINDKKYEVLFPENYLIIFDEAHKCKKINTYNSKFLQACKNNKCKLSLLSATIIDKLEHFKPFGYIFDLYKKIYSFNKWIDAEYNRIIVPNEYKNNIENKKNILKLLIINYRLFPKFGNRMKISDTKDIFKENQVSAMCYFCEKYDEVNKEYKIIIKEMEKNKPTSFGSLGLIIKARQNIENFKLPIIIELVRDAVDQNFSVVIFVNFIDSVKNLCAEFNTECIIIGDQTAEQRQKNINKFQNNESNIIICTIQSGSTGLSLHDLHGNHPRMSIISPSYSGTEMIQTLGRIHRAGSKSMALQRIVYCAKTCEESVAKKLIEKINNVKILNDGDLFPKNIEKIEKKYKVN